MTMRKIGLIFLAGVGSLFSLAANGVEQVGQLPTPVLANVGVSAQASYDSSDSLYTYTYAVSNGAASTASITAIYIDMAVKTLTVTASDQLTLPMTGSDGPVSTFAQLEQSIRPLLLPPGYSFVPFGISISADWPKWYGGLTRDGYAGFLEGNHTHGVRAGETIADLKLTSPGVPTLREMKILPDWVPVFEKEPTEEQMAKASRITRSIRVNVQTLVPAGVKALSWSELESDVAQAIQLGWITDASLAQSITSQLNEANAAVLQQDGTTAKKKLGTLLQTVTSAAPDAIRQEARDLITLNAQALIRVIPDTPIPVTPTYRITPLESGHALGEESILTAKVVNSSDHNKPLPDKQLVFSITDGPNQKTVARAYVRTDKNGEASFSYRGQALGTDAVALSKPMPYIAAPNAPKQPQPNTFPLPPLGEVVARAEVHWKGGADLAVPFFIPPLFKTHGGGYIRFEDSTANLGNLPAGKSITAYYLSSTEPVDPTTAVLVAKRQVPALKPGEKSDYKSGRITLPSNLTEGVYHLLACSDAAHAVTELNEKNNCSSSQLDNYISDVVPIGRPPNRPPVCSQAAPDVALLWPPNHKLHKVSITHLIDPDGDGVSLVITGIQQDESVNGTGDGNTSPDGFMVGTSQVQVRAERSGDGNGRLYFIHFQASDGKGGQCQGLVTVGVPHDHGHFVMPADTGQRYDSTAN